tara:strand:+ start:266 stop:568 length:303 start_codon:yes stop_codon:yes gene_type:complete
MTREIPEKKTLDYSAYLDEIIQDLSRVKATLKKGSFRKSNRKEVDNIQAAIKALRHLKNKNDRVCNKDILLNNRTKQLSEDFGRDAIKNFLYGLGDNHDD